MHFRGLPSLAALATLVGLALCAAPLSAKLVSTGARISWGKPGVSLEQYRVDSVACAREAAALDLEGTRPARALVLASRMLENPLDEQDAARATALAAPEIQWNRAATLMEQALEACLVERGYTQFRMTRAQHRKLEGFAHGSAERRAYLHSLASDPDIIARQALDS